MESLNADFLAHLNDQQRFAVTHTDGPMLILAGAGSGKTRTITYKIAHLIGQEICKPERILAVTFTNKAAEEMRTRVEQLLTHLSAAPLVCTFHSFTVRILRRYADRVGYGKDFTICDTDDQKRIFKTIYRELQLVETELPITKSRSTVSSAKSKGWGPQEYARERRSLEDETIARIYAAYQRYLRESNAVDFDDLLLLAVRLLEEHQDVRESYGNWYRYLLIDEYQDTNRPQYDLIRHLTCTHRNLTAVGDEDQSIYRFRGADIRNILRFEKDFPGATLVKLEENYRSSQTILDAATAVVSNNVNRKGKVLWTRHSQGQPLELFVAPDARAEAAFVSEKIYEHIQRGDRGLAVLYRTNFQSRQFEECLRQLRIPYKVIGGVSFYHRREIKDALAYLRLVLNPNDNVSFTRIINEPPRGIGQVTLEHLHGLARGQGTTLWQAALSALESKSLAARAHLALERFVALIRDCQQFQQLPLPLFLEKVLETSGYIAALKAEDTEEAQNRILNLQELITAARDYSGEGLGIQEFLDQAALRSEADDYDESAIVSLITLHNAKGLEFPVVFLAGCEEGLFPHSRSIADGDVEEERRLCYVGLTRAQKQVYLSYSSRRRFFGREGDERNQPSRFLQEIPKEILRLRPGPAAAPDFGSGKFGKEFFRPRDHRFNGKTYDSVESVKDFLSTFSKPHKPQGGFVSGAEIVHEQFGYGRILHVQKSGDDLKLTVQFPGIGIKKLLQSYAKLKLI